MDEALLRRLRPGNARGRVLTARGKNVHTALNKQAVAWYSFLRHSLARAPAPGLQGDTHMRWNRARLAAAAIAVVALAAGCSTSSGSSATGGSSASAGTPKKGGALTIIYQNEVTSLDPT